MSLKTNFYKKCPSCENIIYYSSEYTLDKSIKYNTYCKKCSMAGKKIKTNFIRNCPSCNKEISYKTQELLNNAIKKNNLCLNCSIKKGKLEKNKNFKRQCPQCNKEIFYKTENNMINAENKKSLCDSCRSILVNKNPITKNKIKNASSGKNNPMYGKSTYDIWLEKYGKKEADKKQLQMIEKCKNASSGENNPMYGKPPPKGAGNGWSGHYKNIYFRSILEFNYLKYLLDNNIRFENGEKSKHKIPYETTKGIFNYHPDYYLIDTEEIIEIKPKNLINTYVNQCKFKAAKEKLGDKHIILTEDDIKMLDVNQLYELYLNKEIIFNKKSEEKFLKYYEKHK